MPAGFTLGQTSTHLPHRVQASSMSSTRSPKTVSKERSFSGCISGPQAVDGPRMVRGSRGELNPAAPRRKWYGCPWPGDVWPWLRRARSAKMAPARMGWGAPGRPSCRRRSGQTPRLNSVLKKKYYESRKYALRPDQISCRCPPSRPTKGRFAIVTDAGRDAVDTGCVADESPVLWTVKSCGPGTPTLVSSSRQGARTTVANKPGAPGRARSKP